MNIQQYQMQSGQPVRYDDGALPVPGRPRPQAPFAMGPIAQHPMPSGGGYQMPGQLPRQMPMPAYQPMPQFGGYQMPGAPISGGRPTPFQPRRGILYRRSGSRTLIPSLGGNSQYGTTPYAPREYQSPSGWQPRSTYGYSIG